MHNPARRMYRIVYPAPVASIIPLAMYNPGFTRRSVPARPCRASVVSWTLLSSRVFPVEYMRPHHIHSYICRCMRRALPWFWLWLLLLFFFFCFLLHIAFACITYIVLGRNIHRSYRACNAAAACVTRYIYIYPLRMHVHFQGIAHQLVGPGDQATHARNATAGGRMRGGDRRVARDLDRDEIPPK